MMSPTQRWSQRRLRRSVWRSQRCHQVGAPNGLFASRTVIAAGFWLAGVTGGVAQLTFWSLGVSRAFMTHVLVTQNDFLESVFDADGTATIIPWTFPKSAKIGDTALIYCGSQGIFARATILSAAKPADDLGWPGRYGGDVGEG